MTGDGRWIVSDDHSGGFSDGGVRTNWWTKIGPARSPYCLPSLAPTTRRHMDGMSLLYTVLYMGSLAPSAGQGFRRSPVPAENENPKQLRRDYSAMTFGQPATAARTSAAAMPMVPARASILTLNLAVAQPLFQQINQQKLSVLSLTRLRMGPNCFYKFFAVAPIFLKKFLLFNFA